MKKPSLPQNVWTLAIAQPMLMAISSLNVFIGGIIGADLAPSPRFATLPVACVTVGTALSVVPVTMAMKRMGRKRAISLITLFSSGLALLSAVALVRHSFVGFCAVTFLFGMTLACVLQFRFAAMESVPEKEHARAASLVLVGGVFAAVLGPEIALAGKELFRTPFAGSYVLLAILYFVAWVILQRFRNVDPPSTSHDEPARPLSAIARQPLFWVAALNGAIGYSVMSFVMTATPVSMHKMHGHTLLQTKWVIQSHILAMYLPSFFAARTIRWLGLRGMMLLGSVAYLLCLGIGVLGAEWMHFEGALILLGIGWNFMFIGGTTLLPTTYRPSERFKVQGLNEAVVFGLQAFGSLSAGWVLYVLGWRALLLLIAPAVAIQFAATWYYMREPAPQIRNR